jgi:hypothetical protein
MAAAAVTAHSVHWSNIATASAAILQAVALVVAGAFGYVRFIRRRVHHASITPEVTVVLTKVDGRKSLKVDTAIKNTGTYMMVFTATCEQLVRLSFLERSKWRTDCHDARLPWTQGPAAMEWDQLVDDYGFKNTTIAIEPGDTLEKSWLVPVPPGDWVAYQVTFDVDACAKKVVTTARQVRWSVADVVMES